jgi:heterodisulfide reductase subunit A
VRAIPGDVYPADRGRLNVVYAADGTHESREEEFDLVSLSIGITPCAEAAQTLSAFGIDAHESGFFQPARQPGVFIAGTAAGPMSIAESVADAERAAVEAISYLTREA